MKAGLIELPTVEVAVANARETSEARKKAEAEMNAAYQKFCELSRASTEADKKHEEAIKVLHAVLGMK